MIVAGPVLFSGAAVVSGIADACDVGVADGATVTAAVGVVVAGDIAPPVRAAPDLDTAAALDDGVGVMTALGPEWLLVHPATVSAAQTVASQNRGLMGVSCVGGGRAAAVAGSGVPYPPAAAGSQPVVGGGSGP